MAFYSETKKHLANVIRDPMDNGNKNDKESKSKFNKRHQDLISEIIKLC